MTTILLVAILAAPWSAPHPGPSTAPVTGAEQTGAPHTHVSALAADLVPDTSRSGAPFHGTATWYCGSGSPCTSGYGPGDLIAAIDRKDSPYRKGDRVRVTHDGRSVTVRIVDVCGCPGRRVIDLSAAAFARLAPLGRGVIPVTLEAAPTVRLPETSTAPYEWRQHR
jgi:hypothetical protein